MLAMQPNAQISTSLRRSNLYRETWPNTEEPALQDMIQLFIGTYKTKVSLFSGLHIHILDRKDRVEKERGEKEKKKKIIKGIWPEP